MSVLRKNRGFCVATRSASLSVQAGLAASNNEVPAVRHETPSAVGVIFRERDDVDVLLAANGRPDSSKPCQRAPSRTVLSGPFEGCPASLHPRDHNIAWMARKEKKRDDQRSVVASLAHLEPKTGFGVENVTDAYVNRLREENHWPRIAGARRVTPS
jgi:hypothetical protein